LLFFTQVFGRAIFADFGLSRKRRAEGDGGKFTHAYRSSALPKPCLRALHRGLKFFLKSKSLTAVRLSSMFDGAGRDLPKIFFDFAKGSGICSVPKDDNATYDGVAFV